MCIAGCRCLGLPISVLLAFKMEWGISGLWGGCLVAATLQSVIIPVILLRLDWRKEACRAAQVVGSEVKVDEMKLNDAETLEVGVDSV
jgi:Na+-driven multidrug efflux pump